MIKSSRQFLILILAVLLSRSLAADITPRSTIDDIYDAACASSWLDLKHTIAKPGITSKPPWADVNDSNQFVDYLKTYLVVPTTLNSAFDTLADDELTVASECIKRRNAIVDAHFNRNTGGDDYALRIQTLLPIFAQYSVLSRQAIALETARRDEEAAIAAAEAERLRRGRIMTTINQNYLKILQLQ